MPKDNKTITPWELPETNQINDNDIFILTNSNITHKVTGKSLIQYLKNHEYIADYFVHQDTVGSANGVAALDGNKKILSENIPFGSQAGAVYEGASGKALETAVGTKADRTELVSHVTDQTSHIASVERNNWNDCHTKKHDHSNKSMLDGITLPLITGWNNAATHISDSSKHIAGNERILWNTVEDKVTKVDGKSLSTNDYSDADKAKLQSIENGANHYQHPDVDGAKHIPSNGTTNGGKYLKASFTAGSYEWGTLTKDDVESALGYTPGKSESITYRLNKSDSNIILTGSDGSSSSVTDSDTACSLSDLGIVSNPTEINQLKGVKSNIQTQLNNIYTKSESNALLNDKLSKTGDGSNLTTAFTEASSLSEPASGETQSTTFGKLKLAVKNVISIARVQGASDISAFGDGTVTGILTELNNRLRWNIYNNVAQLGLDTNCTTDQIIDKLAEKGTGSMLIMAAFRPAEYPNMHWASTEGQHMYTVKCLSPDYVSLIDEDISNGVLHYCTYFSGNYSPWDKNMCGFLISPITLTTDAAGLAYINLPGMIMSICTSAADTVLELIKNNYQMYYVHVKKYSDQTNYTGTFQFWVLHSPS